MNKKQAKNVSHFGTRMSLLLLLVFSLHSVANAQTVIGSKLKLLPTDQVISNQFKAAIGNNRLVEFQKLEYLIKPISSIAVNNTASEKLLESYVTNVFALIYLLGQPDAKISKSIYQYNLGNSASNCKLIVGMDKTGKITFQVKKDCN